MSGKLYLVATPIGNLQDITLRALDALRQCDVIVCEDTRVTSKLLSAYEISKPLRALHEHSLQPRLDQVVELLKQGKNAVYVSDAGTPGVNDPGGKLVAAALQEGITVMPIPGPSALTAAISVCGFPMDEFFYAGFAPHKKGRLTFFKEIAQRRVPTVFFESTHRIMKTLDALSENLEPERMVFLGRELTKLHETLYRGTAVQVRKAVAATSTKGEFTVIVGPAPKR